MVERLPRNPEKYFKKTPDRLSGVSKILDLFTYESRGGILLGSLEEVKSAIVAYVTQLRLSEEPNQNSDKILKQTLKDLESRLKHANEEAMKPTRESVNLVREQLASMPNVPSKTLNRVYENLKEVLQLLSQAECLHEGQLHPARFMDYPKESLLEGAFGEVSIETNKQNYVVAIKRKDPGKNFNEGWFEERLASMIGKERLIYEAGIKGTFNEVDGCWYNIPLFEILKKTGLKHLGREMRIDILNSKLKEIGPRTSKKLGRQLLESSTSPLLCYSNRGRRYEARFQLDNLHSRTLPVEIEDNDELKPEEKHTYRYAHVKGNNIIGPAWTIYRSARESAHLERPVLQISLTFPGRDYMTDTPIVDQREIDLLIEARNQLAEKLTNLK